MIKYTKVQEKKTKKHSMHVHALTGKMTNRAGLKSNEKGEKRKKHTSACIYYMYTDLSLSSF